MDWKPYDPAWLVELARAQRPDLPWLADALARCTRAADGGRAYLYFADPAGANAPGSDWQYEQGVTLEHAKEGTLVIDVLAGERIGGVEFLSRL